MSRKIPAPCTTGAVVLTGRGGLYQPVSRKNWPTACSLNNTDINTRTARHSETARNVNCDITGAGRALGLTEMGEIKAELEDELKSDTEKHNGFRSMLRLWLTESQQASREVAETIIANQTGSLTERAYNRTDFLEQRRELMEVWVKYLNAI